MGYACPGFSSGPGRPSGDLVPSSNSFPLARFPEFSGHRPLLGSPLLGGSGLC